MSNHLGDNFDAAEKQSLSSNSNAVNIAANNTSEEVEKQEKQTGLASFFENLFKKGAS